MEKKKTVAYISYYLSLALVSPFFGVFPALILYILDRFSESRKPKEEKEEITYQDILLFKSSREMVQFLKGDARMLESSEELSKPNYLVIALAWFFSLVFAYAYSNPLPLVGSLLFTVFYYSVYRR